MFTSEFEGVQAEGQLAALQERSLDQRPAMTTPFPSINALFHRNGVHPGELVVLGGRKGTRKTCVALTWTAHLLREGVPVGFLTLDESLAMYVVKLMSALYRIPAEVIEEGWGDHPDVQGLKERYIVEAANLTMSRGVRPTFEQLQRWLDEAEVDGERPRVVFCDYTSLLAHQDMAESERVRRLFEELQVWTRENDITVVTLHQAGRTDEGVAKKYHGDTPMTAEGLLYSGEQQADIILSTYRPAMNPLGNMSRNIAEIVMGNSFDEEKWADACARVRRYERSTMLQVLKNRPSTKGEWFEGSELHSPNESQYIEEKGQGVTDRAEWTS